MDPQPIQFAKKIETKNEYVRKFAKVEVVLVSRAAVQFNQTSRNL